MAKESSYYPTIKEFLKTKFKCDGDFLFSNKGTDFTGRCDVIGIHEYRERESTLENRYGKRFEIYGVEVKLVKDKNKNLRPYIGQAYSYSVFANRCYLAVKSKGGLNEFDKQLAETLGVGLIEIQNKKECSVIVPSPYYHGHKDRTLGVLKNCGLLICGGCGLPFERSLSVTKIKEAFHKKMPFRDNLNDPFPLNLCKDCVDHYSEGF